MTKIRQFVSFGMAVIMMCSTVNPHSVYADELPSEPESVEQSETEQPTEIESVTEAESEIESETASETDTELENDGIYNDAEYIDDLMINEIAVDVYASTRPTGDGRETSGGSLSSGGHRVTRTSGGHSVSSNTTASQTINNIIVNFLTDIRNDVEDIANFLENIRYKLGSINNNIIDVLGYQYDIFVYVQKVYNEVVQVDARAVEIRNLLQKFETILNDIKNGVNSSYNASLITDKLSDLSTLLTSALKDTSGTWIAQRVYNINSLTTTIRDYLKSTNTILNNLLKDSDGNALLLGLFDTANVSAGERLRQLKVSLDSLRNFIIQMLRDGDGNSLISFIVKSTSDISTMKSVVDNIYNQLSKLKTNFTSALSANGKWFTTIFIEKFDELISAVKNLNQKIVIVDNTDRTKSDDEEENASLIDLVTMIMYSVFILASLLDLLLLLLEYVVLMFQIPAVPALMNENVLLGWNYANAICIPGTQFSIVSFLRLLMYITVIFSAIKVIKKAIDNGSIGVI